MKEYQNDEIKLKNATCRARVPLWIQTILSFSPSFFVSYLRFLYKWISSAQFDNIYIGNVNY